MYRSGQVCHGTHVEIRGQSVEMASLLQPCGTWGSDSGLQSQWQGPLPAEPFRCPNCPILLLATVDHLTEPTLYIKLYNYGGKHSLHRFAVSGLFWEILDYMPCRQERRCSLSLAWNSVRRASTMGRKEVNRLSCIRRDLWWPERNLLALAALPGLAGMLFSSSWVPYPGQIVQQAGLCTGTQATLGTLATLSRKDSGEEIQNHWSELTNSPDPVQLACLWGYPYNGPPKLDLSVVGYCDNC